MGLLAIFGEDFPDPDEYRVDIETIGTFERNANGNIVGDLTGIKKKINCSWVIMEDRYFKKLVKISNGIFADVEYFDPGDGNLVNMNAMINMQSGRIALKNRDGIYWSGVSCYFIER